MPAMDKMLMDNGWLLPAYRFHTAHPVVQSVVPSSAPRKLTEVKNGSISCGRSNFAPVNTGDPAMGFRFGAALLKGSVNPIALAVIF